MKAQMSEKDKYLNEISRREKRLKKLDKNSLDGFLEIEKILEEIETINCVIKDIKK